jgi:hypothetical protein
MNVRLLLIGNVKLWHITAVVYFDLMQFRLDNTGGHISFSWCFIWLCLCQIIENGTDLSKIVSLIIALPVHLKPASTPFRKVHKTIVNRWKKELLK